MAFVMGLLGWFADELIGSPAGNVLVLGMMAGAVMQSILGIALPFRDEQ